MNPSHKAKIQQSIALLQQILGGKSDSSPSGTVINIPGFDEGVSQFKGLGSKLQPEIQQLTKILSSAVDLMKRVMNHSSNCKKFAGNVEEALKKKFMDLNKQTDNVYKNPNYSYHVKAIRELIGATFWVFSSMPEFTIKGGAEAADFNAIKFQKLKNDNHNDWYKAISNAFKNLQSFAKKNYPTGLVFNFNGTGNWLDIVEGSAPLPPPVQQKHHSQHKKVQQPKASVKKAPKKELQGPNWFVGNFENSEVILSAGEVQMKHGIFIENCEGCVVKIEGKFKSLQMNQCKTVTLVVASSISGVEVMNGENIKVYVRGHTPSVSIDKCEKVRVVLSEQNLSCDLVTSKVTEFNLSYTKGNGDQAKDYMVSEQLITKWNPNSKKFETKIYDQFL